MESTACDLAAVPEWARESIARTARELPENLPGQLSHVAEIEAARRYMAGHPAPQPSPPDNPRDCLHLAAIGAWQAIAAGQPAPGMDPAELFQCLYDLFAPGASITPVEQLIEDWYELARKCGIDVNDEEGELRPDIDAAITRTVTASIWFGITTGYLTLAGSYQDPPQVPGMKDGGRQPHGASEAVAGGETAGGAPGDAAVVGGQRKDPGDVGRPRAPLLLR